MGRWIVQVLLGIIIILVIVIAAAPTILSTTWGKNTAVTFINKSIPGKVRIESLSLSWMGPQKMSGLTLIDPNGNPVITLKEFITKESLLSLTKHTGDFSFNDINASIQVDGHGHSNLERSLFPECCHEAKDFIQEPILISLKNFNGHVQLPKEGSSLLIDVDGLTSFNSEAGKIALHMAISPSFANEVLSKNIEEAFKHSGQGDIAVNGRLENFPTSLLDQILILKQSPAAGSISELLGKTINLSVDQKSNDRGVVFVAKGNSPTSTFSGEILASDAITLLAPIEIKINISPEIAKRLTGDSTRVFANPIQMSITVINIPVKALTDIKVLKEQPASVRAQINQIPLSLFTNNNVIEKTIGKFVNIVVSGQSDGNSLIATSVIKAPNIPSIEIPIEVSTITKITQPLHVSLPLEIPNTQFGNITVQRSIDVQVSLDRFELPLSFTELLDGTINISPKEIDSSVQIQISPLQVHLKDFGNFLVKNFSSSIITKPGSSPDIKAHAMVQNTNVDIGVTTLQLPDSMEDFSRLKVMGNLVIDTVVPVSNQAALDDIKAQWVIDGYNGLAAIDFRGLTRFGQEAAGIINGTFVLEKWIQDGIMNMDQSIFRGNFKAHRLPTEILAFKYGGNDIAKIIGNTIDLTVAAKSTNIAQKKGTATVTVHSDHLAGDIALAIDDHIHLYSNEQPGYFEFTLTPEGHAAIRNLLRKGYNDTFSLSEPSKIVMNVNSLDIPLSLSWTEAAATSTITINQIVGVDRRTQQRLALESIQANIVSEDIGKEITFALTGNGQAVYGKPANINIKGSIDRPFNSDGTLNKDNFSLKLDGNLTALPAPLLCKVLCSDTLLSHQSEAIFGPTLDATVKIQLQKMNGLVAINAQGNNGNFYLNGQIQDGVLTLNEDLKAQVAITPQLGQYILQEYIPILNGIQSSDQPLSITISKNGFYIPIKDITPSTIVLGMGKVDFGKVKFSSQSQLAKALSLLTPPRADSIEVWLTPIYASMNGGIVKLERVDLLLNERFPLAAWGTVNFPKDRVDMIIGLSGAAIDSAFNLVNVPRSYILQVPLKGPLNNPSLDKTRVAGRLSALTAQTQGGAPGSVIGSVLDILTGGFQEASPPKPTTQPLPWQDMMVDKEGSSSSALPQPVDQVHKTLKAPIDEIGKGLKHLFKKKKSE